MNSSTGPVTEASSTITEEIDVASTESIIALLQKCDAEIFNGYQEYKPLLHDDILQTIENIAGHIQDILEQPENGLVVFSGCGTSGRLGFIVTRTFNELQAFKQQPEVFRYLLAGGDKALFTSQEAPEDDPQEGIEALKKVSTGKTKVVFVGITCGLSAPYVAGQLDYCLDHPEVFIPVLLGFNPTSLARNIKIDKWDKTFMQVVDRLQKAVDSGTTAYVLNPIVGPEPITGSSRMKGGTATKILIETVCFKALYDSSHRNATLPSKSFIDCYNVLCEAVYKQSAGLAKIVDMAGKGLNSGGSIYYLGTDSLALMGLIDASECPPTYGATLDDVRGFVEAGYATLKNADGDLSHFGRHFRISLDNFEDLLLTARDVVIVINAGDEETVLSHIRGKQCTKVLIAFDEAKSKQAIFDHVVHIDTPKDAMEELIGQESLEVANRMFREIAVKWCLNAITTGAHILKGKVYRNIMIDVKVSNNKLFHRAVGILEKLGHLPRDTATEYLLRSIYNTDNLVGDIMEKTIAQHVAMATPKDKVVPVALVAAVTKCTISEAKTTLSRQPVIRTAIVNALQNVGK
ncbi:glucokinase regulatory protein-like isoform X2 [Dreissena polymorpha]|uniref:SIS domain-containing protein n=2 Tax=Dreissena polymorpha TaxID=45954 RepID=A0A9D4BHW7_DREPO|nr:glucokinase regulatory protein-like isoform X2 [Dreissena polymorpha]XP_052255960.1 glucokinase regulatory protein-like isoform X2 [Dreissena polymorpha]KAH3695439.1 hypothetical protein DPMN_082898 [Dreissena polymorpha]